MSSDLKTYSVVLPKIKHTLLAGVCLVSLGLETSFAQTVPAHINTVPSPVLSDLVNKGGATTHLLPPVNGKKGKDAYIKEGLLPKWVEATAGSSGNDGSPLTIDGGGYSAAGQNIFLAGSTGGAGGKGGSAGRLMKGDGAAGGNGGDGGNVSLNTTGNLTVHNGSGIVVFSNGGQGGKGGDKSTSIDNITSGAGGNGGNAGQVTVTNESQLTISGNQSFGIFAQAAGGHGGKAGDADNLIFNATAGLSGDGGSGGTVTIINSNNITTNGSGSDAIHGLSLGGNGAGAAEAKSLIGSATNGVAGNGGDAGTVTITNDKIVTTQGAQSNGLVGKSVGGKGGNGNNVTSGGSVDTTTADGGHGGNGGGVNIINKGSVTVSSGHAIYAESTGGAGGASGSATVALVKSESGNGGNGGNAGAIQVDNLGAVTTTGDLSSAVVAVSTGGEGGSANYTDGLLASEGGSGGHGGNGGAVSVNNQSSISTQGNNSNAIIAVSAGGKGGDSDFSVSELVASAGSGGAGGAAGDVVVNSQSDINRPAENVDSLSTMGDGSRGIYAQSVGGSGGNGGMAGALSGSLGPTTLSAAVAIGGNGGAGADAGNVHVTSFDHILTKGNQASGIEAVSQGGDGGNGGGALEAAINAKSFGAVVAIGGTGGNGGAGADSSVTFDGRIQTTGEGSHGIRSASAGGKGGDAGNTLSAGIGFTPDAANIAGSVGGAGGKGGAAGDASVDFTGKVITTGKNAHGILAESLGGEGGQSALNIAGAAGHIGATNGAGSWGRGAGDGGAAGNVNVETHGLLKTEGDGSDALVARSVGGQGGAAQQALSGTIGAQNASSNTNVSLAVAGNGGNGAEAGTVTVNNQAYIYTGGQDARAIAALSEGGAGGNGGTAVAGAANLAGINEGQSRIGLVGIAGSGGYGADGGVVNVTNSGEIYTTDVKSAGLQAHSLGGKGGNGGDGDAAHALFKVDIPNVNDDAPSAITYQLLAGGAGGQGGDSAQVVVSNHNKIFTGGNGSTGIDAQSIGGAGGNGGNSKLLFSAGDIPFDPIKNLIDKEAESRIIGAGGTGGAGGNGADVTLVNQGAIFTYGDDAAGILARSVGGQGGHSGDGSLGIGGGALTELVRAVGENTQTQSAILDQIFNWADDVSTGGDAGAVSVTNGVAGDMLAGRIQTSGDHSAALIAETLGGAGGDGGNGLGKIALGGDGGRGGHAGDVDVVNHASLATFGDQSSAIIARATGGAGGTGGDASSGGGGQEAYLTFGGRGGKGGNAANVSVDNHGSIWTTGDESRGIQAQSVGGAGGVSGVGQSKYVGIAGGALDQLARENLSWFGGTGAGGNGADVTVSNHAKIITEGDSSTAIEAKSLGGKGAKAAYASGIISLGGDGGVGGNAGNVDIANHGILITKGQNSAGIAALSQGGIGGAGGSIGTPYAREGFVSLGGRGGKGGDGADVSVANQGSILTFGKDSNAILAQSVGGAGSKAGDSKSKLIAVAGGAADGLINTQVDWYGRTGAGGNSGNVSVINGDALNPGATVLGSYGENAGLIVAKTTGGKGGAGGNSSGVLQFDVPVITGFEAAIGASVAGDGGLGGNAGDIKVENHAILVSLGDYSTGITAHSTGGRGGNGGYADVIETASGDNTLIPLTAVAGGLGGSGGDGGDVLVVNSGGIYTEGKQSSGISALSLGGSGGIAGNVRGGLSFAGSALNDLTNAPNGTGGRGGNIHVINGQPGHEKDNLIYTTGHSSIAINALSIGGDGSLAGVAFGALKLGGNGGNAGNAGTVSVENHAGLITKGDYSHSILAQSIGGTGGVGSRGNLNDFPEATNGTGGDAGSVSVVNSGVIVTSGNRAYAIAAESRGGMAVDAKAGDAGDVSVENSGVIITSGNAAYAITALSEGAVAGAVTVHNTGDVETAGENANGIAAKSLGKTSAGDVSIANSGDVITAGAGSNALTAASVVETDTLFASRAMPQVAQASAFEFETFDFVTFGGGQAGNVSIDHSGNLIAKGEGSSAIYAQSTGETNGNIDIVVQAESLLVGGSAGGAGVSIIDGAKNSLANHGTITAVGDKLGYVPGADGKLFAAGWVDGLAIQGTTGTTDISNSGLVVGIIDMGIGSNRFTNNQDAWMVAGTYIGLGGQSDSLFTNAGVLTSGGIGAVETTVIDGNFDQTETGNYLVDLDFAAGSAADQNMRVAASTSSASGKADRLDVTGQANLGGHLPVSISNTGHAKSGQNDYVIVRAEGGVQDDGMKLEAPNTAVATFTLGYTEHETVLGANIDYAAKGLTENGIAVGNTINDIQFDQTSPAFRPLASAIFAQADIASLQRTYDLIDGEGTAGAQQAYFSDTNAFIGAVSQQTNIWSNPYRQAETNASRNCTLKNNLCVESLWRGWYSGFGSNTSIKGDPYVVGSGDLKSHSKGMAAGLDYELTKDLLLGFSVGMSKADFKVSDRLTKGDIETGRTAIYGAYRHNNFYVDGLVGVDWFNASTDRLAAILPTAGNAGFSDRLQNDFSGYGINARLETGYRMDLGGVQVTPFAALQLSSFHMNSSTEYADITGGDLALYYKSRTIHSVPLSLGAQVDTRIDLGDNAHFSPYLRAAWVHEFANKRSVEAGFITAPGYEFVVHGAAQPRNSAQVEAGFNVQIETGLSLYGKVTGNFSGSNHDVSGSGGLRLRW
ncbi:hypothetical protein [Paenochrobactrum glaciei]